MRDNEACLCCGEPFPPTARVDRKYCSRACNNRHYKQIRRGAAERPVESDPRELLSRMTPEQLAWVTGIFEGEGCVGAHKALKIGHVYVHPLVKITMVDEDIIRRCAEWTGIGRVTGPHLPPSRAIAGHQAHWAWNVNKESHVMALVEAMWPLLGERRRAQVSAMRQQMSERTLKRGRGLYVKSP